MILARDVAVKRITYWGRGWFSGEEPSYVIERVDFGRPCVAR